MGVAIREFRDAKHFLPAARIADGYATWAVQIGPYLSASGPDPFHAWDLRKSYSAQSDEARTTQVLLYYCPSRRAPPELSVSGDVPRDGQPGSKELPGALGDYAGCSGDGDPKDPWQTAQANGAVIVGEVLKRSEDLVLDWRGRVDLGDLKPGQSQTILVGEKHVPWGRFGKGQVGDGSLYDGGYPAYAARVGGPGYGLAAGPEAPFHDNFGSYHPGICQFLFADTSMRPLVNTVSEEVLGRMTRRGE
jgi:hypothetical protein